MFLSSYSRFMVSTDMSMTSAAGYCRSDRNAERVIDRLEVLIEPFLVGLL